MCVIKLQLYKSPWESEYYLSEVKPVHDIQLKQFIKLKYMQQSLAEYTFGQNTEYIYLYLSFQNVGFYTK